MSAGCAPGTLNVTGIVGFGAACEIAGKEMPDEAQRLLELRNKLQAGLFERLDEVYLNGHPTERLPGNLNVSFAYVEGESLLMGINDIAVSSGSACTSATLEPSYVIRALGIDEELAHSSIRFGLGRFNTEEEVDFVTDRVTKEVKRLREMSPLYEMAKEGIDLKSVQLEARVTKEQETKIMAYSEKVLEHYNNPRNVGSFAKDEENVGTGVVGAPECGDVMKLQLKINRRRRDRGCALQDLRLRQRDRELELRDRTGQGQAYRRSDDDQEHRHRQGAELAAGEDSLLGAGRGRDQGGDHRLAQPQGRRASAREPAESAGGVSQRG